MKQNFKLTKDQQTLVEKNLSIVHWVIVNNIHVNPGICGLEYGDLFQEGCLWPVSYTHLCYRNACDLSSQAALSNWAAPCYPVPAISRLWLLYSDLSLIHISAEFVAGDHWKL